MKYDVETIKLISLFEKITRARVKGLFMQHIPIFIVVQGDLRKALGKENHNLLRIEHLLKKKIKIIEHSDNMLQFVQNVVAPIRVKDIKEEDSKIIIVPKDTKTRGYLIGRAASALRNTETIVKKYYPDVTEIKVM